MLIRLSEGGKLIARQSKWDGKGRPTGRASQEGALSPDRSGNHRGRRDLADSAHDNGPRPIHQVKGRSSAWVWDLNPR
ncbi:hypothetical protein GCM10010207_24810 [Streptomyces atratus]|nr:hypothetical protein GCM10010207_24810 [Streptomyces atratus]